MKRLSLTLLFLSCTFVCGITSAAPPNKPKLIVALVIDQFRYDYLLRFRTDYTSGFKTILEQGAVFDDAHYIHYPTVTAVGHSTFLSGAIPALSGIVSNEWFERETGTRVTSVSDPKTQLIGAGRKSEGSSPRRLLVSTLGDELKISTPASKVIGVSIKDRSAILPAGHMADGAYWFDNESKQWVTSTYFMNELPDWVTQLNDAHPASRADNTPWLPILGGTKALCTTGLALPGLPKCKSFEATPWANEIIEEFAERAVTAEKLGSRNATDLLTISFSANDYVGHAMGPDSPEVRDISIRTDRLVGKLFDFLDKSIGLSNVMFVMTADHGVAAVPEVSEARKMPGGRLTEESLLKTMNIALEAKYGTGNWFLTKSGTSAYLNDKLINEKKLDRGAVAETAATAARTAPHIFRAYTSGQLVNGGTNGDSVSAAVRNGMYPNRAADILVLAEPGYLFDETGTTHGSSFGYDTHVPVVFMGQGIKPGHYFEKVIVNDIAPTLAAIAGVAQPDGSTGRVLQEIWQ